MRINKDIIIKLNPCESRFNNYLSYYKDFDGTLEEFLALDNITYSDKVWVFARIADKYQLLKWSYLCAESVLYIFEARFLSDKRPRQTLDAILKYINAPTDANLINLNNHRNAAAYDVAYDAAYAAAAADDAADVAYDAAYAAAADDAADAAIDARKAQQDLNLLFMIEAVY
jgi:hypothetical protein